jgi:putative N-acetylmannosamine-6-phosphate epimerase
VGLALAALEGGAAGLRIESLRNVRAVRAATWAPIIGLVKRPLPSSPVFITPEIADAAALAGSGADIVAFDATLRARPVPVRDIVAAIHAQGSFAMADVSTSDDAQAAVGVGADLVGTTLSGYTGAPTPQGPDLNLVSRCAGLGIPVLAEGRYRTPAQARLAIEAGARTPSSWDPPSPGPSTSPRGSPRRRKKRGENSRVPSQSWRSILAAPRRSLRW